MKWLEQKQRDVPTWEAGHAEDRKLAKERIESLKSVFWGATIIAIFYGAWNHTIPTSLTTWALGTAIGINCFVGDACADRRLLPWARLLAITAVLGVFGALLWLELIDLMRHYPLPAWTLRGDSAWASDFAIFGVCIVVYGTLLAVWKLLIACLRAAGWLPRRAGEEAED